MCYNYFKLFSRRRFEIIHYRLRAESPLVGNDLIWVSDRYIEDGSYLRISNISLTYNQPFRNKKSVIKRISVTATVGNPWIWTKYSGWDPDVNSYGTIKKLGADMGSYPSARTFKVDLKFNF